MSRGQILFIDGHPGALIVARNVLSRKGYDVVTAGDPEDGLLRTHDQTIDLIVIDAAFAWPEIVHDLYKIAGNPPIMLSAPTGLGATLLKEIEAATEISLAGFLEKPFVPDRLLSTVDEVICDKHDTRRLELSSTVDEPDTAPRPAVEPSEILRIALNSALPPPTDPTPEPVKPQTITSPGPGPRYHTGLVIEDEPTYAENTLNADDARIAQELQRIRNTMGSALPSTSKSKPAALIGGMGTHGRAKRLATRLRHQFPVLAEVNDQELVDTVAQSLRDEELFAGGTLTVDAAALTAGKIGEVTVPHVVQLAENLRFPVWVRLAQDIERIEILVVGQHILFARQRNLPEMFRMGRFLIEQGAVDGPTINRAISNSPPDKPLGQRLAAQGLVSTAQIERALKRQIEELVCEAVSWDQGQFSIVRCQPIPKEALHTEISVHATASVLEGMRRLDEWQGLSSFEDHMLDSWSSFH